MLIMLKFVHPPLILYLLIFPSIGNQPITYLCKSHITMVTLRQSSNDFQNFYIYMHLSNFTFMKHDKNMYERQLRYIFLAIFGLSISDE